MSSEPSATIRAHDPLAVAVVEAIRAGDVAALRRLLDDPRHDVPPPPG